MIEAMRWFLLEGFPSPVLVPPLALSLPARAGRLRSGCQRLDAGGGVGIGTGTT